MLRIHLIWLVLWTAGHKTTIWQVSKIWCVISLKKKIRTLLRGLDEVSHEVSHLLYKVTQLLSEFVSKYLLKAIRGCARLSTRVDLSINTL